MAIANQVLEWIGGGWASVAFSVILFIAWAVLGIWISLAAVVKRWHDLGFSGWMQLLAIVPLVGFIVQIVLLVWPGEKGENKYGPQP